MPSRNKRIDDLQAASGRSAAARRELVEPQLTAFANWQLPHDEAVELLGESQLDAWRSRMVNLVRWACVRRTAGEQPGLGDPIQIATLIASHPPGEDPLSDLDPSVQRYVDPRMTEVRKHYLESRNIITEQYLVSALLATTLLGGPDGAPLRQWIAEHAPDAWSSNPRERDGYHVLVWLGPRFDPYVTVEAILAMEDEVLDDPWNIDDIPNWPDRGARKRMRELFGDE